MSEPAPSRIVEYRIPLPMTVEEFERANLYTACRTDLLETGGGEGVEVVVNEPSEEGRFTHKIWHLTHKVPKIIRQLAPKGSLEVHEKSQNTHPRCTTESTNPDSMKAAFYVKIESVYLDDDGSTENALNLQGDELAKRQVINIDIAKDSISNDDYKEDEDPTKFKSTQTGRGPLASEDWKTTTPTTMCCYKVVKILFVWWGLQDKVEGMIQKALTRGLMLRYRRMFCWTDDWYNLTMDDIRKLEEKTKADLEQARFSGAVTGMVEK